MVLHMQESDIRDSKEPNNRAGMLGTKSWQSAHGTLANNFDTRHSVTGRALNLRKN